MVFTSVSLSMIDQEAVRDSFLNNYQSKLESGDAAVFIGAGLSAGAGYVDWRDLMRDIAREVRLEVDRETDLVAVAQYHVNTHGNRAALNRRIVEAFSGRASIHENHRLIARLPVRTLWTTNYDRLIETAYADAGKTCQPMSTAGALAHPWPRRDAVLYKMHGDVEDPANAVVTKDDYETYRVRREQFVTVLTGDLLTKTFLFLGFSFTDPNLDYLLGWIRAQRGDNPGEHYWVTKKVEKRDDSPNALAEYEYHSRKQELRVKDMQRYGIQTLLVSSYAEITDLLGFLTNSVRSNVVFVSGSAHDFHPLGHERFESLIRGLSEALILRDCRLVTGFGLGVGGGVVLGAIEALHMKSHARLEERLILRPFPRDLDGHERSKAFRKLRHELLEQSGYAIFLSGNRLGDDGQIEAAEGVFNEFEIAVQHEVIPIPIASSGHAAAKIWQTVSSNPKKYFRRQFSAAEEDAWRVLGDPDASNEQLIDAAAMLVTN